MPLKSVFLPFLVFIAAALSQKASAQAANTIGFEVQAYPAGIILSVRGGVEVSARQELSLRLGYNIARRGDFGKHDREEGGGPGFSLGYRYYFHDNLDGAFLGVRSDLWFMDIDWRDDDPLQEGTTDITVLQPSVEAGYNVLGTGSNWLLAPTVSFGYEFNIKTEGEKVGEGTILLGGLNVAYLF